MALLDNIIALVTGAARGNGAGIARVLAEKGATVILTGVHDNVFATAESIGKGSVAYVMDVADYDAVKKWLTT